MFRRLVTGMLALLFTVGVIGGAPVLLLRVAGNPLPKHMPSLDEITQLLLSPDNGSLFLRVLTWIGWLAWATFTLSVLIEIPAQIRGRRARRIPGLSMQQKVAGALVGSMIAIFVGSSVAHAGIAAPVVKPVPAMAFATTSAPTGPQDWHAPLTTRAAPELKPAATVHAPAVAAPAIVVPASTAIVPAPPHLAVPPVTHNGQRQGIAAFVQGTRLGLASTTTT